MYKGGKTISWFHAASVQNLLKTYSDVAVDWQVNEGLKAKPVRFMDKFPVG